MVPNNCCRPGSILLLSRRLLWRYDASREFTGLDKNVFPVHSYVRGDIGGNLAFAAHVCFVALFVFSGAMQLVPQVRKRAMSVHRWNGRLFALTALGISVSGLYLKFVRERANLSSPYNYSLGLNAVLIIVFIALTWRSALAHQISTHRRWGLRVYLVANG